MFRLPSGLYFSACLGSLFVSILCTCCSHFSGTVLFPLLCSVLPFFPNTLNIFFIQFIYLFIMIYVIMLSETQNNYVEPKKMNIGFISDSEEIGRNINVGNIPAIRFQVRNMLIRNTVHYNYAS